LDDTGVNSREENSDDCGMDFDLVGVDGVFDAIVDADDGFVSGCTGEDGWS
jgi:hypothetical protein